MLGESPGEPSTAQPAVQQSATVVVVGAGMSGLSAARALHDAGIDVLVLEARDRLGGRTWTADVAGAEIDMGGAWIHGPEGNPVAQVATAMGLSHDLDSPLTNLIYDGVEGRRVSLLGLARMGTAYQQFEDSLDDLRQELGDSASMQDAIDLHIERNARWLRSDINRAEFMIRQSVVELEYSGPAALTSLKWFGTDNWFEGGDHLIEGGYRQLVDALAEPLDIQTQQAVRHIAYDDHGVTLTTDGGQFQAEYAIVTVPLGVLKNELIDFEPSLPPGKQQAISRLDMGSLEKVVLRFDRPFWAVHTLLQGVAYLGEGVGTFPIFLDFSVSTGEPTLVALHGGQDARDTLDSLSDAEIEAQALERLAEALGMSVPEPVEVAVTRWRSDPFSMGSYSYLAVGSSPDDMDTLAEPLGALRFAGEATIPDYHQTVHGAMMSGLREARRIAGDSATLPGLP